MEEPGVLMRWTVFLFGGGIAALAGVLCIAFVVIFSLSQTRNKTVRKNLEVLVFVAGLILVVCGSLVVPNWFVLVSFAWLILVLRETRRQSCQARVSLEQPVAIAPPRHPSFVLICSWAWLLALIAIEGPYLLWSGPKEQVTRLLAIGDSVTAGLNDGDDTWPRQLSRAARVDVMDASQPGATVRSARSQNALLAGQPGLVILEIGGNDLLEGMSVAKFESLLDQLLNEVVHPGRTVFMFELPLPPLSSGFGTAQRRQAGKHGVKLIPKRLFAQILSTKGATVDGIHLSNRGHTLMMDLIKQLYGDKLSSGTGSYRKLERRPAVQNL